MQSSKKKEIERGREGERERGRERWMLMMFRMH
jgi:hypothetical protein